MPSGTHDMLRKNLAKLAVLGAAFAPALAFAQVGQALTNVQQMIKTIGQIVNSLLPIVFALAILAFFYGVFRYIWAGEHDKERAKHIMIWSVIAIAIMVSLYGVVGLLQSTFGITSNPTTATPPGVNGLGN